MSRVVLNPPALAKPAGHFSHGVIVEAGRTLYVAGQTPVDEQGNMVCRGDPEGQARQCYQNIQAVSSMPEGNWRTPRKSRCS